MKVSEFAQDFIKSYNERMGGIDEQDDIYGKLPEPEDPEHADIGQVIITNHVLAGIPSVVAHLMSDDFRKRFNAKGTQGSRGPDCTDCYPDTTITLSTEEAITVGPANKTAYDSIDTQIVLFHWNGNVYLGALEPRDYNYFWHLENVIWDIDLENPPSNWEKPGWDMTPINYDA